MSSGTILYPLSVHYTPLSKLDEVKATAAEWEEIAKQKEALLLTDDPARRWFRDVSIVAGNLGSEINDIQKLGNEEVCFFITKDALGNIQAISSVRDEGCELELEWLVTNPHNIRSKINETQAMKVEGAASAIINHLKVVMQEVEWIDRISLVSFQSSVKFYEKMNFQMVVEAGIPRMTWIKKRREVA